MQAPLSPADLFLFPSRFNEIARSVASPRHRLLAKLLLERRRAAGLTQVQLAQRLGRPQSFVAAVEGGERRVDLVELLNFAEAVGFDAAELVRELHAWR